MPSKTPYTVTYHDPKSFHLFGRDDCVSCSSTPSCNCAADENCILTSRTCSQCPTIQCIKNVSGSSSSINPGVIAGPVIAVLVIASLGLFWWLRRKKKRDLERLEELAARARKAESAGFHLSQPGSPAPPQSSRSKSNRDSQLPPPPPSATRRTSSLPSIPADAEYRDEHGATIRVYNAKRGRINVDPNHPDNGVPNDPFADNYSMSTGRTGDSEGSAHVIPIHFVPASRSQNSLSGILAKQQADQSAAARTLDEARQNLWAPRSIPPPRPARLPDLDLRLHPPHGISQQSNAYGDDSNEGSGTLDSASGHIRDSFLSGTSGAPSYLSGASYDIHFDAPKIVTSKQVKVGRLQTAEMVQFGGRGIEHLGGDSSGVNGLNMINSVNGSASGIGISSSDQTHSPVGSIRFNPFSERSAATPSPNDPKGFLLPSPSSQQTFGAYPSSAASDRTGQASGAPSVRTLTPSSRRYEGGYEGIEVDGISELGGGGLHEPSPTDLRFSMGSLAFDRNSTSTMGTAFHQYIRPDSQAQSHPMPRSPGLINSNASAGIPPPRTGEKSRFVQSQSSPFQHQTRESMSSYKSFGADSLLGAFPMIPPGSNNQVPSNNMPSLPQSMSTMTLESGHQLNAQFISRPPVAFRSPLQGQGIHGNVGDGTKTRPTTAISTHSFADSVLGSFPFVPPNQADLDGLPSAPLPTASVPDPVSRKGGEMLKEGGNETLGAGGVKHPHPGRLTLGMSTMSEGLGDFEFSFDSGSKPPLPGAHGA